MASAVVEVLIELSYAHLEPSEPTPTSQCMPKGHREGGRGGGSSDQIPSHALWTLHKLSALDPHYMSYM